MGSYRAATTSRAKAIAKKAFIFEIAEVQFVVRLAEPRCKCTIFVECRDFQIVHGIRPYMQSAAPVDRVLQRFL